MNKTLIGSAAAIGLAFAGAAFAQSSMPAPTYAADGKMIQPKDYRTWVYLTTGFDMAYAEGAANQTHSFDNVFVNRQAYDGFLKTGVWPDKTVMVLEVRGTGGENPLNKKGEFQGEVRGMEVHVKDASKGGWAFYAFGKDNAPAAALPRTAACYTCHQDHGAVDTTFVQFYPTLRGKMPAGARE
jgi:hypothetical protein